MTDALPMALVPVGILLFLCAAARDSAVRLVPNALPLGIAVDGLALRAVKGDALPAIAIAALIFALATLCWLRGWLGGADVKLFGAGALLVPAADAFDFVLASVLAGGVLAVGYWLLGRVTVPPGQVRPASLWRRIWRAERRRLRRGGPLPYACALTAGACFILARG